MLCPTAIDHLRLGNVLDGRFSGRPAVRNLVSSNGIVVMNIMIANAKKISINWSGFLFFQAGWLPIVQTWHTDYSNQKCDLVAYEPGSDLVGLRPMKAVSSPHEQSLETKIKHVCTKAHSTQSFD